MSYSQFDIKKVREAADIRNHIPGTEKIGRRLYAKCPECGATGKSALEVTHRAGMDLAKCWHCGYTIKGSIDAVQKYEGLSFPEAVKHLADYYGIPIETQEEIKARNIERFKNKTKGSFCEEQLTASGLTVDDVMAKIIDEKTGETMLVPTFRRGSLNPKWEPEFDNDEMLIYYYDLYGRQMKYASRGAAGALKPYIRVRWSNPELHLINSRAVKYQTQKGAGIRFYITQILREAFQNGDHIETLIIQEGEKKAEKACKHGIMSLGIQGIYNIGNHQEGLISDLQYIVKKCGVRNVVLLFDSDWNHLHRNIQPGDDIDQRPNQFAKAAIKFKNYVETLHNQGVSIDVWFGHLNENENGEKGIDDLLTGSLKGSEDKLAEEFRYTMKTHDGIGEHANFHKISSLSDYQIMEFWNLRSKDKFFAMHSERFSDLSHFRFGKVYYRKNEHGEFVRSKSSFGDSDFWEISYDEDTGEKKDPKFDLRAALSFLEANGFYKYRSKLLGNKDFGFLAIDNNIMREVPAFEIRDFIYTFAEQNCRDSAVLDLLANNLESLLGQGKLERLREKKDLEISYEPDVQNIFYRNGQAHITAFSVDFGPMLCDVWQSNLIDRVFKRIKVIEDITYDESSGFTVIPTEDGEKCEFLRYLVNASNFWKDKENITEENQRDYQRHIVNKITSIGYLLADYKYASERKAVVAMDARMSEVGASNGRSGKSMIGYALEYMMDQTVIDGKQVSPHDPYIFSEVTEQTRNIFYDDVKVNFDFEAFFQSITGRLAVNPKQAGRFSISWERSPKFYITTNHAIGDDSPSVKARMICMAFSNWYNESHSPITEFGHNFFYDWDEYQWTLFDNLMAECVMFYFRSMALSWSNQGCGAVDPPLVDLRARQLRQNIGESFLQWAEVYFDPEGPNINNRIQRKTMYDAFGSEYPTQLKYTSPGIFRKKMIAFCQFKGLHLNPHKPNDKKISFRAWKNSGGQGVFIGDRDLSSSNEYFTIADENFAAESSF